MAKESSFKNMSVTLLVITFFASLSLSGVHLLTKDTIAEGEIKRVNEGISEVVPSFDNNPFAEYYAKAQEDGDSLYFYPATKNGEMVGTAVKTYSNSGYGGKITLMVGFLPDGTINNIVVLGHSETPGLGDKIEPSKSKFSVQFKGKNPETFKLSVRKENGDVDAITASTITSKAYCGAITRAYKVYREEVMNSKWDGASGATAK